MASLANLSIKEMNRLAKAKNVDGFKSISRQQLEIQFRMSSAPTPALRPAPRPKKVCLRLPKDLRKSAPKC